MACCRKGLREGEADIDQRRPAKAGDAGDRGPDRLGGFAVEGLTPLGYVIDGGFERFVYHARGGGEIVPGEGVAYEWLPALDDRPFVP